MATQRTGKGEQSNECSIQEIKRSTQTSQSEVKQERLERKRQVLSDQKNRYYTFRWIVIALLLIIAAFGLFYYFNYYLTDVSTPPTSTAKVTKVNSADKKSDKKATSGKTSKKSSKPQNQSPKKSTTNNPKKSTKPTEKKQKKPRLLQKPFSPADPDKPYLIEILHADNLLEANEYTLALQSFNDILKKFPQSPRSLYGKAVTLSKMAEEKKSNKLMDTALEFYKKIGLETFIGEVDFRVAALVELADRAYERGKAALSIKALEKLVSLKEDNLLFSNRLGLGYIADGKLKKAKTHFKNHLENFTDDHFASAQLGYVLYSEKRYEQALPLLLDGIRNDEGVKVNPKFYLYAGESLTKLNRSDESYILYSEAVNLKLFPSIWQRPLFSQPNLRASGWWDINDTGYKHDIQRVEKALETIKEEAKSVFDYLSFSFSSDGSTHSPRYNLFLNSKKNSKNCQKTSKTCALIESFPEAAHCRRGSVKFTFIPPKSHISSFVGLTNTKLQILVALNVGDEEGVIMRVAEEKKVMKSGQILVLDESFEQEIWNPGSEAALFLLIDVWHPDLSDLQMRQLGPI